MQQAVGKPPRLRLFLTPAMEEDMTPEQYHDGNEFFAHAQDRFWCAPGLQCLASIAIQRTSRWLLIRLAWAAAGCRQARGAGLGCGCMWLVLHALLWLLHGAAGHLLSGGQLAGETAHGLCPWRCFLFWLLETQAWQATIPWASLRLDSLLHPQHKDMAIDVLEHITYRATHPAAPASTVQGTTALMRDTHAASVASTPAQHRPEAKHAL